MRRYFLLTLAAPMLVAFVFVSASSAQSAKFKVLHTFTGGSDGVAPQGPLVIDPLGDVYGVTVEGGSNTECYGGCGTVFEVVPSATRWKEKILFNFAGSPGIYVISAWPLLIVAKRN